jgi:hypothetical protein
MPRAGPNIGACASHLRLRSGTLKGWKRPFDDPIPLPRGRQLVTLQDAGNHITKLPKVEHEAPEWAGSHGMPDLGRRKEWADNDGAHWRNASAESAR